tara:strand:+ start:192 stop:383 length:192 start_codon:yes stop_codon:yes gene_type:complete
MATSKNKPKRLDRNKSWRVARRKRKINDLVNGKSRSRAKRPKNKNALVEKVVEKKVEKVVEKK